MADHWYDPIAKEPRHFVEKKDGSGTRPTTIADARKNGWVPSVTTVLKASNKPALIEWLCRNAAVAAVTTPRIAGEDLDAFIERILRRDAADESEKAKDLGTQVHAAIEAALTPEHGYSEALSGYVLPVLGILKPLGRVVWTERILIGEGYAGKADALFESEEAVTLCDFKTGKKIPDKKAWPEHELQLSAYAKTIGTTGDKRLRTAIFYISTSNPGNVKLIYHDNWQETFTEGFMPLRQFWCWMNNYYPDAPRVTEMKEFPRLKPTTTMLVDVPMP